MNIYVNSKKGVKVRTLEKKDIPNIIGIVSRENFGYVGLDEVYGINVYDTHTELEKIVDKEIISSEALIIEQDGKFRGYAIIDRPSKDRYHISQIAIQQEYRRKGYGKFLLDVIKKLANQDNSTILLTCNSYSGSRLFDRMRIYRTGEYSQSRYSYDTESSIGKELPSIFPDYSVIRNQEEKQIEERVKSYSKFLKSDIGQMILKI